MVYCEAKRILEAYEKKEGSIHSLIAKSNCQHKNSLTCLIMKSLCYKKLLKKIVKRSQMLEREKFLGDKLAVLLVYDVLFGMGVRGKFKGTIKRNFESLNETVDYYVKKHECASRDELLKIYENFNQSVRKPKYVFLNRLNKNKKEIFKQLKQDGFNKVDTFVYEPMSLGDENDKEEDREADQEEQDEIHENRFIEKFKEYLSNMTETDYFKDDHVKYLLIFSPKTTLNNMSYSLFKEGHLLQIDKSSCLVPVALNPPENSHCIDAAAAPGNKTILLSNLLNNTGLIHAFDIDESRVKQMNESLKHHHVKNVRLKCLDFLLTEPSKYDRVEYILLDPSCSGSGMTNRLKFGDQDVEMQKDEKRVNSLSRLQRKMVLHAMSFPSVKRIVYSTCSIHEEENERVVRHVLEKCEGAYRLVNLFSDKPFVYSRGITKNNYEKHKLHLDYCIRMSYNRNFTNGFFISCFERVSDEDHVNHDDDQASLVEEEMTNENESK